MSRTPPPGQDLVTRIWGIILSSLGIGRNVRVPGAPANLSDPAYDQYCAADAVTDSVEARERVEREDTVLLEANHRLSDVRHSTEVVRGLFGGRLSEDGINLLAQNVSDEANRRINL